MNREPDTQGPAKLIRIGLIGAIVTAVCCLTPVLVILLSALGLAAFLGKLDYVLLPALSVFVVVAGFGLWKQYGK